MVDSPFTRAMFSPRPTLSLTLLMSLAGGKKMSCGHISFALPHITLSPWPLQTWPHVSPPTSQPICSHLVLEADLGPDDIGSPADYSKGQVLFRTWLGQAALVLPGPWF